MPKNVGTKITNITKVILSLFLIVSGCISFAHNDNKYLDIKYEVSDGDTIKINNERIRLFGIDAPEKKQLCYYKDNTPWNCGVESKKILQEIIGNKSISCSPKNKDLYGRIVAICYVGNIDINKEMVKRGYAVAYIEYGGKAYINEETYAKTHKLGMWQGTFELPKDWRKKRTKSK